MEIACPKALNSTISLDFEANCILLNVWALFWPASCPLANALHHKTFARHATVNVVGHAARYEDPTDNFEEKERESQDTDKVE